MHIFFNGKRIELDQEQTVLSALLDQGYGIPNIYPTRYGFRFKIFVLFVSWRGETTMNSELL